MSASHPRFASFSPIVPVRDLQRALAHYTALGFDCSGYARGAEYGFANRDHVSLHLSVQPDLFAAWCRADIGGSTRPVATTPYKLREGAHIDPDGNLIRFGSPILDG